MSDSSSHFDIFAQLKYVLLKNSGKVTEGMDIVKNIESLGTASGKPKKRVVVAASGELK